jgi:serine/threonine-protein kinase
VLYELATGTPVFEGASSVVVLGKQLREKPEAPRARAQGRGISESLDRTILCALEKSPNDRFASAAAMREALAEALSAPEKSRSRARKRTFAIAALGAVLVVATAAGAAFHGSPLLRLGATPIADVTRAFEPDVTLALPLPSPPAAIPDLSAAATPPPESNASSPPAARASSALPPLPLAKTTAFADAAHATSGKDTKPDPEHQRRGHGHSLATLDGLETVSHKTHR